jgi:hypothetical protein
MQRKHMNQKYIIIMVAIVLGAVFIGSMYVIWKSTETDTIQGMGREADKKNIMKEHLKDRVEKTLQERMKKEGPPLPKRLENRPLSENEKIQVARLIKEDDLTSVLLDYLENPPPAMMKRVNRDTTKLQYDSEKEWIMHVTVNHFTDEIESITLLRRGNEKNMNLLFNPQEVKKVAQSQLGQILGTPPLIGKVVQTSEGIEVEFLSDNGVAKVAMKIEDGAITEIEPIPGEIPVMPTFSWKWPVAIGGCLILGIIVVAVVYQRRKSTSSTESESSIEDNSDEVEES